ncbi:MAG: hypothetical protein GEU94_02550 [Micromonosporaceae bacterium]|nr:hypothetical protein [Micromonosporaceae bacterium]
MSTPRDTCPIDHAAMGRRRALTRILGAALVVPAGVLVTGCGGPMGDSPMGDGMGASGMPDWMMSRGGMDRQMMRDMPVIHDLLTNHEEILRQVDDLPDGIRSQTTSRDPDVAKLIGAHVRQMRERVENGDPIRQMDPLFREIFEHHETIEMQLTDIDGGVEVVETSPQPQVAALIRQHAHRAVSEFVASGMRRAMRPTPLPSGYRD